MNSFIRYEIVAVRYTGNHCEGPAHQKLVELVNEKLAEGYEPLGRPFFGEVKMYQALTKKTEAGASPKRPKQHR